MRIRALSLRNFRNLREVDVEPHPHFNILAGPNGAGKSNVLEAIHMLANVRSFRDSKNRDLIRVGTDRAQVLADIDKASGRAELRLDVDGSRKRFTVNGKGIQSFASYLGTLFAVIFSPADLQLLRGAASARRRFVDRLVCGVKPAHLVDLQDYEAVIRSRNQLLKEDRVDRTLLDVYTDQLAPLGGRITARRMSILNAIGPMLQDVFAEIFSASSTVDMEYQCKWWSGVRMSDPNPEELEEALKAAIEAKKREEMRAGHTLVGPQRDDLIVSLNGLPMREFASQGQTRSAVLALKITELRFLEERSGDRPILLLDDVSSELDRRRNEQLFDLIAEIAGQTFITTTDRRFIRIDSDVLCFDIEDGVVSAIGPEQ